MKLRKAIHIATMVLCVSAGTPKNLNSLGDLVFTAMKTKAFTIQYRINRMEQQLSGAKRHIDHDSLYKGDGSCPVCGSELNQHGKCPSCGFGEEKL